MRRIIQGRRSKRQNVAMIVDFTSILKVSPVCDGFFEAYETVPALCIICFVKHRDPGQQVPNNLFY